MTLYSNDIILGYDRSGRPVILPKELRGRHAFAIGATGVGKSKMLESLLRQDFLAWPDTRAGLALFDPHGTVVDNLLAFCAAHGLNSLPIIPLDCRRLDYLVSFNPLRARKGIEAATIVSSCIDSPLHAWGDSDTNQTPRLEKWLRLILLTVFLSGGTMGDSLGILRSPELRRAMARHLEDDVARTVWASSASLKESEFQNMTESLANRVVRFVSATMLRLSLNQTGASLDFGTVLDKGGIVLISLATAGGAIDEMDARTLGALLLQDLWTAARIRGKGEAGQKRPFRVYLDEFQKYLTPSMAEGLAEARGFALEFFLACQSTTQMTATPAGQQVLDAVLANAHTKIVFNVQHPMDLDTLTPWLFRNKIDPDAIKHQHYATRVLGHQIKYMQSTSRSTSRGTSRSTNWSTTESVGHSTGSSVSHTQARGTSASSQRGRSTGESASVSASDEAGVGTSAAESSADGVTESRSSGCSRQTSSSRGENRQIDGEYDDLKKIVGAEPTATFDRAYVDEDEEHRKLHRTIGQSESQGGSEGTSESDGLATTHSRSNARAEQASRSHSQGTSRGLSTSESEGESEGTSNSTSDGTTKSENTTTGLAETQGGSETESESTTEGTTLSPMLLPQLGQEALPPAFAAVEEQMFRFSQILSAQPDRTAVVRTGSTPPVSITTPTVAPAGVSAKGVRAWATLRLKKLPFALRVEEASRLLAERQRQIQVKFLGPSSTGEPKTTARRIKE